MALKLPAKIRAGDSLQFSDTLSNYPAPNWTITYSIANESGFYNISSTASGADHSFSIPPATTQQWAPGKYYYQATVSDGTDRFSLASGSVDILPDFSYSQKAERSHVERTLDNVEKTIEKLSSKEHSTLQFNGRSYTARDMGDLIALRDKYKAELAAMNRAERVANGLAPGNKIRVRF